MRPRCQGTSWKDSELKGGRAPRQKDVHWDEDPDQVLRERKQEKANPRGVSGERPRRAGPEV